MLNIKRLLKEVLPHRVLKMVSGLFYGWHGDYSSWSEAEKKSSGYDSGEILEKVKRSALQVKDGLVAYERDSFVFTEVQYSYPLLSSLMWIAARNNGRLNVLDFGGSLGSTYFQNKQFLDSLPVINWCIVEQKAFVEAGINLFENDRLHFYHSIAECIKSIEIDLAVFSSVLQYLEAPKKTIEEVKSSGVKYIIVDRTPFIEGHDRITIQKVNPEIYKGSYPCWFFNKASFLSFFTPEYKLIIEFDALDEANINSEFKGFLFEKTMTT
jgi:putative methyltransferase (TIGR04325 family)